MPKRILFLYSEFMPYNIPVWLSLKSDFGFDVHVVYWDHKKLTPYQYPGSEFSFYKRSEHDRNSLISLFESIKPEALFVSGRMDRDYLYVARQAKTRSIPVIMGSDKQWKGNWKDWIFFVFQKYFYRPYFTHACIPGERQRVYCNKVGFTNDRIVEGLYCANIDLFKTINATGDDILFVGRLEPIKGVMLLVEAVRTLKTRNAFTGKLRIYGSGSLKDQIPHEEWIICNDFADQSLLKDAIQASRIFCLPSVEEPWGVVVHEMAAAGLLICCSDACGAGDSFVRQDENGYVFKTSDQDELVNGLMYLLSLKPDEVERGRALSRALSREITPFFSASQLSKLVEVETKEPAR
ncbi:MAG: glycosyltransferase family 4 protein [Cytophagales bacterium]|jgi:glycosyltransferase involved in cell wall biosynthesis|nr:glycosyltransferase family 4 protein [Cytophagales bacterium]MCA6388655.1 glycosyltransferase family 4 protein [Cytophagales bacterium]MCA6393291.1 glycosyltransferase family 4 protein [Cytophagales bacterium]MCA6396863.1 glycosyltransferase family 4 protein [Cytophagales bacterium]MCA6398013.1 glycosyltransferase family 4 protein [Cytophagales bacterium]